MPVTPIENGVEISRPENAHTVVRILNYGATVISWKIDGEENLWLSKSSMLDGSRAIRGGIPLVFPRFGPPGKHEPTDKLPQHGFARSVNWELLGQVDETTVVFGLGPEQLPAKFRDAWPYDFTLKYTVSLGTDAILLTLDVENPGSQQFDFNVLFHTYFTVPNVDKVQLEGLSGLSYWNKVTTSQVPRDEEHKVTLTQETDRVYADVKNPVVIDYDGKPLYSAQTRNLRDVVVWNPWRGAADSMTDFAPADGYLHMVCVENGDVAKFLQLQPGGSWSGSVKLQHHL